jgi:putative addiction module component (TIGR02574 family)
MAPKVEEVLANAKALTHDEQVELIEALVAGLDDSEPQVLTRDEMDLLDQRIANMDAHPESGVTWDQIKTHVRRKR